jgi:hypothetical protein
VLDAFTFVAGVLFFACVPLGLIFLALGLFNRAPRRCMVCGYDRHGLRPDSVCPECAANRSASSGNEIRRVNWQVRLGTVLLCVSGVPFLILVIVLIGRSGVTN